MFNKGKTIPHAICFDAFGTLVQIDNKRHPYRRVLNSVPEPQIYQIVCDKFQLEPKDVLFVGDSIQNDVNGPAAFGMSSMSIHDFEADFVNASCDDENKV